MSGGSMNYVYSQIEYECVGKMGDHELDDLMKDVAKLVHDREWCLSGDTCEETYQESVQEFKRKWFGASRSKRLREYIDDLFYKVRSECLSLIGDDGDPASAYAKLLVDKYGDYVDKKTAAEIIGVTRQTVYAMIEDKRIQTGCRGKKVYVPSIADYMKAHGDRRA